MPSICLKIEVSNNYCILITTYVHNKWISKYIRPTNNVCFYKRTKGSAAVLRKSSACPDFCNKRQKISVIRLTHFLLKKHWIPKLYSIWVHLLRNIDPTSPTYLKSTLYINSEYLALFCALLIDHFELKTKISVRNFETAGPVITRYLALYFYINNTVLLPLPLRYNYEINIF